MTSPTTINARGSRPHCESRLVPNRADLRAGRSYERAGSAVDSPCDSQEGVFAEVRPLVLGWPGLLALALFLIAFATYGYRARPHHPVNRWFALQTLTLALWVLGIAGAHAGQYPEFWGRWTFASACLMPAFSLHVCVPNNSRPNPCASPFIAAVAFFRRADRITRASVALFRLSERLRREAGRSDAVQSVLPLLTPSARPPSRSGAERLARLEHSFAFTTRSNAAVLGAITSEPDSSALTGHSDYSESTILRPAALCPLAMPLSTRLFDPDHHSTSAIFGVSSAQSARSPRPPSSRGRST